MQHSTPVVGQVGVGRITRFPSMRAWVESPVVRSEWNIDQSKTLQVRKTRLMYSKFDLEGSGEVELCLVDLCSPRPPTDLHGGEHRGEIAGTWTADCEEENCLIDETVTRLWGRKLDDETNLLALGRPGVETIWAECAAEKGRPSGAWLDIEG